IILVNNIRDHDKSKCTTAYGPGQNPCIDTSGNLPFAQTGDLTNPDGLKGMYQDEIIGGIEYEFMKSWAVGVKGIYKSLGRTVEDRCDLFLNPDVSSYVVGDHLPDDVRINQPSCAIVNPGEGGVLNTIKDPSDPNCYPNGAVDPDTGGYKASSPCESTHA